MVWFERDEAKAKTNERKHGVRFYDAILVFADPYALTEQDRVEGGELRLADHWVGRRAVLLLVAHTIRDEGGMKSFASSRPERPRGRSANTMTKIVKKTFADIHLSAKQKRELKRLAQRPDSEIDLSDIPELTEKFWRNAVRNPFHGPVKKQLMLRLDADVIAWLRRQGKGYQTRANALLRAAMLGDVKERAS